MDIDSIADLLCNIKDAMQTHFFPKEVSDARYAPMRHDHPIDQELDANSGNPVMNRTLTPIINGKAEMEHSHEIADVNHLQGELNGKAPYNHDHDTAYYTKTVMDGKLENKADTGHTHSISQVTNLQTTLDNKAPKNHNHDTAYYQKVEVLGLLADKSDKGHNHDAAYPPMSDFYRLSSQFSKRSSVRVRLIRAKSDYTPYPQDTELDNESTQLQVNTGDKLGVRLYSTDNSLDLSNREIQVYLDGTHRMLRTNARGISTDMIGLNGGGNNKPAYAILKGTDEFYKDVDIKIIQYNS